MHMSHANGALDREIELKFLCEPADLSRAMAAAPAGEEAPHRLVSIYFDTPAGALRKAGVSFRVRQKDGRNVQTLKRGEGFDREEHEVPLASPRPDLSVPPLVEVLDEAERRSLAPIFGVRVTRHQRLVRYRGAEIEIAADEGEVGDGQRSAPISEVELELKSGEPRALFDLARDLAKAAPLYLSFEGKASQGQALVDGTALSARRKDKATLARKASTAEAFQTIARNALTQIAANAQVLRQVDRPEAVHQLRVATRRLRSLLKVFKPMVGDPRAAGLGQELKWLARTADDARNLDVLLTETVRPALNTHAFHGLSELDQALESARLAAQGRVADAVRSERFRALVLEAAAWVETGDWLTDAHWALKGLRERRARDFAADALEARWRKLLKRGRGLADAAPEERHAVRLAAKTVRYAAEAFAPLFDDVAAGRFIDRLRRLQDRLGALNDLATADKVFGDLPLSSEAAFAAGRLMGEGAGDAEQEARRAAKAFAKLRKTRSFWRA